MISKAISPQTSEASPVYPRYTGPICGLPKKPISQFIQTRRVRIWPPISGGGLSGGPTTWI
jgi:hypothetical protein